jgi:amino acid adenylation domain-containing protein
MQVLEELTTPIEEIIEGYRLSPQQKHLWLTAGEGTSDVAGVLSTYKVACEFEVTGEVELWALEAALAHVLSHHEILRTRFDCLQGMQIPVQVIGAEPTLRWSLREIGPNRHKLIIELPAMCADRAGLRNVAREVCMFYKMETTGRTIEPADDLMQYVDLSEWLNQLLEHEAAAFGQAYWRQQDLSGLWRVHLPLEPEHDPARQFKPHSYTCELGNRLSADVKLCAAQLEVPPAVFLLTCWGVLLQRLSQQADVVVGVFHEGRKYDGLSELPGLLGRYVPTPIRGEEGDSFVATLRRLHEVVQSHQKWQEYFAWEHVEQSQSKLSFFPYAFEYVEPPTTFQLGGIEFRSVREEVCIDRCNLELRCVAGAEGELFVEWQYDSNLYTRDDIERLSERFLTLLTDAARRPEASVGELEVVSERERRQLVHEWNDTVREYPRASCIHELFEAQMQRTPQAPALIWEGATLSYAELNARAERMAAGLRRLGVGPEARVGLVAERSDGLVAALLGILKAGAAYVPIDPQYPRERAAFILQDAGVRLLLTGAAANETVAGSDFPALSIEQLESEGARDETTTAAKTTVHPDNLAYVIYTSGSTGQPKGVMVTHASVHNFFCWKQDHYRLTADDRLLLKSPLNFDPSVWELFWPLQVGACVVVARPSGHLEPSYLVDLIRAHGVTMVHFVPSMAEVFLDTPNLETCTSLKYIVCGGEALPPRIVNRLFRRLPVELHNSYGPTETTIAPLDWECTLDSEALSVPIGRPISNSQIYLLDSRLRPVPAGVPGELCVGGASLARGYLNRSELTAQKFVPNPYADDGARLYRTGDLARQRADGVIEFLGRIDHQVKIRGNRIEPGEIEAVLGRHESVRQAVVMLRDDAPGEARLIAYVASEAKVSPEELREHLRQFLPEYMVPSAFVVMDSLPLAVNGKVDRQMLPPPGAPGQEKSVPHVAPRTETENVIAQVWREVLGVESIGIEDNFFDVGGHSLLAVSVNRRLRELFDKELSVVDMFKYTTISGLAAFLTQENNGDAKEETAFEEGRDRGEARKNSMARHRQLKQRRGTQSEP